MRANRLTPVFLLALAISVPAALASDGGWTAHVLAPEAEETNRSLRFERAAYEVDVYGSVAAGVLVQEFVHDGETALTAFWIGEPAPGIRPLSLEIEVDGRAIENPRVEAEPDRSSRNSNRGGARAVQRKSNGVRSTTFQVGPGESVVVRQSFQKTLTLHEGRFRLALPAVAGLQPQGEGSRRGAIAEPVPESVLVRIHCDEPLVITDSDTHALVVGFEGDKTVVELAEGTSPRSRDFALEFSLGSENEPALVGYVGPEQQGTHELLLVFAPAVAPPQESIRPKQLLFVLDTSGSMRQGKLDRAREALSACMENLNLDDHYNVLEFDSKVTMFHQQPVKAAEVGWTEARSWMDGLVANGGTQLLPALSTILDQPENPDLHRIILLLTDGIVRDEEPVLNLLGEKLGASRLFVIGIGQDAKRETIERLAEYGRGAAAFVDDPESIQAVLAELFGSIAAPVVWDLHVDWDGADVDVVGTDRIPDLYAGRAVTIRARVRGEAPSEVRISGNTMDGQRTFELVLPPAMDRELPQPARARDDGSDSRPAPSRSTRSGRR